MQSTEFRDVPEDPRGAIWGFHFARPIFSFSGAMCWKTRLVLKTGAPEYLSSGALSKEPITCYPRRPRGSLSGRPGRSKSGKNWRRGQFLPDLLFPLFKVLSRGQFSRFTSSRQTVPRSPRMRDTGTCQTSRRRTPWGTSIAVRLREVSTYRRLKNTEHHRG